MLTCESSLAKRRYHNVHDACQSDRYVAGLNAPLETVELYPTTVLDTWKVQAAMTTELDYGVGNVTAALKVCTRFHFCSQPLSHAHALVTRFACTLRQATEPISPWHLLAGASQH
jgi:hypothetical protein